MLASELIYILSRLDPDEKIPVVHVDVEDGYDVHGDPITYITFGSRHGSDSETVRQIRRKPRLKNVIDGWHKGRDEGLAKDVIES